MKNIQVQGNNTILEIYNGDNTKNNTRNLQRNKTSLENPINDCVTIIVLNSRACLLCKS